MKRLLITTCLLLSQTVLLHAWGWVSHRHINAEAISHLPPEMGFFAEHYDYLREHSVDPDQNDDPSYWHYIDIDYYPEFFAGTLPHDWDSLTTLYPTSTVIDQGTIPWVIDNYVTELTTLFASDDWENVWQVAAELGHYVADSHQPLHLTLNYNGQLTHNYGIHSRYETQLMYRYLDEIPNAVGDAAYWDNVLDSVFQYIGVLYPQVEQIMLADDLAYAQDSNHGDTYYDILWQNMEVELAYSLNTAILDLASIWYTAWVDAGSPSPAGVTPEVQVADQTFQIQGNFPNPFNPSTHLRWVQPEAGDIELVIQNLQGKTVESIQLENRPAGSNTLSLDMSEHPTSLYICTLRSGHVQQSIKMMLVK